MFLASRWRPAAALALPLLIGCSSAGADTLSDGRDARPVNPGSSPVDETTPADPGSAFTYGTTPTLLPFDVRLTKLARVLDVDPSSPVLEAIRARRLELGDHDYAAGVKPDLTWTPTRIGTWVKALKPVCTSQEMKARYPALPERLDHLVLIAYGRDVTEEDKADVAEALGTALDSASAYQTVCYAILSSLEFVAR